MVMRLMSLFFLMLPCVVVGAGTMPDARPAWVPAWSVSPDGEGPEFDKLALRQVVRAGISGKRLRVLLSNRYGNKPLYVGAAHVALHGKGSAIVPGSDRVLLFHGREICVIPEGAELTSDPLDMSVSALQELAITLVLPQGSGPSTQHGAGNATAYLAPANKPAGAVEFGETETSSSRFFLMELQLEPAKPTAVLVALGDSITDGVGSTPDANKRWPDLLGERLLAASGSAQIAVVNAGIAGNRVLHDGVSPFIGPAAIRRFDSEVLRRPGVRWVVLLEGTNDIAAGTMLNDKAQRVTASQIIAGLGQLVERAHGHGIKVMGATLLPMAGAEWPFHTAAGDAKRREVNEWIRHGGAFDAVVDFDALVRDPQQPEHYASAFDSGDHLHPNDAGHKALADAVDLGWLR